MTDIAIETHNLTRHFGKHRGIANVSLSVEAGEIFGFLGPNGAGKSTTIRHLLGLMRPDSGTVRTLGFEPCLDEVELAKNVGYLPGELALIDNLTGRTLLDRFAGLRALTDRSYQNELVERFDVDLNRPVAKLSKGNRQKIGIVAAFMHRPRLLVLDEPTSGLDPLLQDEFANLIRSHADDGATVFLSSHELDEVQRVVDRLAIIRAGSIVLTDTITAMRQRAPRRIELRFSSAPQATAFDRIDGVTVIHTDAHTIAISLTGPMAPVLQRAAELGVIDLNAPPTDLDTLFLSFYHDSTKEHHAA